MQFNIHLIWVPRHRDILGNCKAHELSRMGIPLQMLDEVVQVAKEVYGLRRSISMCEAGYMYGN